MQEKATLIKLHPAPGRGHKLVRARLLELDALEPVQIALDRRIKDMHLAPKHGPISGPLWLAGGARIPTALSGVGTTTTHPRNHTTSMSTSVYHTL